MNTKILNVKIESTYRPQKSTLNRQKISFELVNSQPSMFAAIRRVVCGCLFKCKRLSCSAENIKSDDPYVIPPEIVEYKIPLIPIIQDIQHDTTFSIEVKNTTNEKIIVKSGELGNICDPNLHITALNPGRSLSIKNIHIVENDLIFGGPGCTVVGRYEAECLDHVVVNYLEPSNVYMYVKRIHHKKLDPTDALYWFKKRVLILGDPNNIGTNPIGYNPDNYDKIIPITDIEEEVSIDKIFSNSLYDKQRHFYLSFYTYGTLDAREIIIRSLTFLKKSFETFYDALKNNIQFILQVDESNPKYKKFIFKDAHELFLELLFQHLIQDTTINCRYIKSHYSRSEFTFEIAGPDGILIMLDAIEGFTNTFNRLLNEIQV